MTSPCYSGVRTNVRHSTDRLDAIPPPQRVALSIALGMRDGDSPDQFLVSLAALSLLSETSTQQPTLCVIDDAQWLDSASGRAFASLRGDSSPIRWCHDRVAALA